MFLKEISESYAPSGMEEEVRKLIIDELSDFYSDIKIDNLGNLIIHKPGKLKSIGITASMDEVSFLETHSTDDIIYVSSICSVKPNTLQNILLTDNKGNIYITNSEIEQSNENKKIKDITFKRLNNCKGNKLDNDNLKQLVYTSKFINKDNYLIGKALERTVSCSILCDIARKVVDSLYEYYFIFSVQNYCDKKGAAVATYNLKIDELYNICGIDTKQNNTVKSGNGMVIVIRDKRYVASKELIEKFDKIKDKQFLVSDEFICEGGRYCSQKDTANFISIGIPIDNMYCPNELININDYYSFEKNLLEVVLP